MTKVAVYGSLRKGMSNHGILEGATFLGTTKTVNNYTMYSLGGFPKVALDIGGPTQIVVEIYEVDDQGLRRLHRLEGFRGFDDPNNFYDLSAVDTVDFGEVLIYHINGEDTYQVVEDGDWVNFRNNR